MGEYDGVVGGVSGIVTDGFKPWWEGMRGTIEVNHEGDGLTLIEAYDGVLDWQVESVPVYVQSELNGENLYLPIEGKLAQRKSDDGTILGIVSDGFATTQNEVLVELAKCVKTQGDVLVKSAGGLFGWKQVWILCKLGEDKHFEGLDETLERYLLLATGHDGSLSLSARPTNVRVECMNTFDWAIKGTKSLVNLRHTKNVGDRIEEAKTIIRAAYDHFDALDAEIEQLLAVPYSRTLYQDVLVPQLVGPKPADGDTARSQTMWEKKRDGLVASFERPDQRNILGTGWGAVMAVNSYEQWGQTVRGQSRAEAQGRRAVKGDFPLTVKAKDLVLA